MENKDKKLQDYADLGKDLLKKDGLWESAITDLEKKSKPASSNKWLIAGIGLLLLLVVCFFIYQNNKQKEPIYMAYYEAVPTSLVPNVRGNADEPKTELQKAVLAYADKDFEAAETLLYNLVYNDNSDLGKLYLASLYLHQAKSSEAIKLLNQIPFSNFNDIVEWNQALALMQEDKEGAKKLLSEISEAGGHYRSKKAQEILKNEFDIQ